jgi:hypothetical protein
MALNLSYTSFQNPNSSEQLQKRIANAIWNINYHLNKLDEAQIAFEFDSSKESEVTLQTKKLAEYCNLLKVLKGRLETLESVEFVAGLIPIEVRQNFLQLTEKS